ncbi:MAG: CoA pyrophosphatase [Deltaproteobacteria bacterium]|nr:MAG: CoA pyrophosphatase [Deltaproteobacteria bacterium]
MPLRTPQLDEGLREHVAGNLGGFRRRTLALEGRRPAAVALVLVGDAAQRPCFVLTRRASQLKDHGGQWALPGGSIDRGETPERTALRELEEEVGLSLSPRDVLGLLDDFPTRSGFVITPVVVWGADAGPMRPNPREVAAAFQIPIAALDRPDVPKLSQIPESDRPLLSIPLQAEIGTTVHAPTAAIIFQLREVAFLGRPTRVAHYEQPVFAWR